MDADTYHDRSMADYRRLGAYSALLDLVLLDARMHDGRLSPVLIQRIKESLAADKAESERRRSVEPSDAH